jgi:ribosomal protein S18 acetylase RimI-like enzyme
MTASDASGTIREVRAATPADVEAIARFNEAMALETEGRRLEPATIRRGVRRVIERPDLGFYLVADGAAGPVACLLVTYEWSDWRDGLFFWIQSVFVRPESRGRGIFAALYREVESRARSRGDVRGLRLYVEKENLRAQRTYARLGMFETGYRLWEAEF